MQRGNSGLQDAPALLNANSRHLAEQSLTLTEVELPRTNLHQRYISKRKKPARSRWRQNGPAIPSQLSIPEFRDTGHFDFILVIGAPLTRWRLLAITAISALLTKWTLGH